MTNQAGNEAFNSKIEQNKSYLIEQSKMLQDIIKRMANSSLELKKSGLVTWTALIGFGFANRIPFLFLLALILSLIVALLDVLYLQQERKFRNHFNILSKVICDYPLSPSETKTLILTDQIDSNVLMNRVEGNFIKLVVRPEKPLSTEEIKRIQAKQKIEAQKEFWIAAKSWANLLYPIIFLFSIILLFIPLPPFPRATSAQVPSPTLSPSAATLAPSSSPVITP